MSIAKTIKEISQEINNIENEIKNYKHPEEKLRKAQDDYNNYLIGYREKTISDSMELQELELQLNKPLEEYSKKRRSWHEMKHNIFSYSHPIAENVRMLRQKLSDNYMIDYYYREMVTRKDILDNFNGYMTDAENRLKDAKEQEYHYTYLLNFGKYQGKRKEKKEKTPCAHVIRTGNIYDGMLHLNTDDIKAIASNGANGFTVVYDGNAMISVSKQYLKTIIKDMSWFECGIKDTGLFIKYSSGYVRFKWHSHFPVYPGNKQIKDIILNIPKNNSITPMEV